MNNKKNTKIAKPSADLLRQSVLRKGVEAVKCAEMLYRTLQVAYTVLVAMRIVYMRITSALTGMCAYAVVSSVPIVAVSCLSRAMFTHN